MEINCFEWRVPRAVPGRVSPQDRQILTWPSTSFLGFPGVSDGKNLPATQETWVWSLSWEDPLEKRMAIHSSNLAWRKSWTEGPGGLQGYSPWGCKELDMTEQLVCARTHTHTNTSQLSLSLSRLWVCSNWLLTDSQGGFLKGVKQKWEKRRRQPWSWKLNTSAVG